MRLNDLSSRRPSRLYIVAALSAVAVAHTLLVMVRALLTPKLTYHELGEEVLPLVAGGYPQARRYARGCSRALPFKQLRRLRAC
jgi:hypothetical protein